MLNSKALIIFGDHSLHLHIPRTFSLSTINVIFPVLFFACIEIKPYEKSAIPGLIDSYKSNEVEQTLVEATKRVDAGSISCMRTFFLHFLNSRLQPQLRGGSGARQGEQVRTTANEGYCRRRLFVAGVLLAFTPVAAPIMLLYGIYCVLKAFFVTITNYIRL